MIRRLFASVSVFLLALASSDPLLAAMSVSASVESGTYDRVFEVKLVPSDPAAKLFYTFEPDGSPMDAYAYTGAIRVAASTPLMYFAFTDPTNESPIYRQDYELRYSTGVLLSVAPADRVTSLSRPAAATGSVALDSWTLRKDDRTLHEFAATDFLASGAGFSASFELPSDLSAYGEYSLVAPDGTIASVFSVSEPRPQALAPAPTSRSPRPVPSHPPVSASLVSETPTSATNVLPTQDSSVQTPDPQEHSTDTSSLAGNADTSTEDAPVLPAEDATDTALQNPALQDPAAQSAAASGDDASLQTETDEPAAPQSDPASVPDISASARTFGGLLPLAFMFLVALAASVWRVLRVRATAKKLR